jgi:hypothetical protein
MAKTSKKQNRAPKQPPIAQPNFAAAPIVTASSTAKYVQNFDERAVMNEAPPTEQHSNKGSPTADFIPAQPGNARFPQLLAVLNDETNLRSDGQVLTRTIPGLPSTAENRKWKPGYLRITRDASGENL